MRWVTVTVGSSDVLIRPDAVEQAAIVGGNVRLTMASGNTLVVSEVEGRTVATLQDLLDELNRPRPRTGR